MIKITDMNIVKTFVCEYDIDFVKITVPFSKANVSRSNKVIANLILTQTQFLLTYTSNSIHYL